MPDQWIIRVEEKEYGPADLETLREWKREGRVLATNGARHVDSHLWMRAEDIPGLFEALPVAETLPIAPPDAPPLPPVQSEPAAPAAPLVPPRPFREIIAETFRIYGRGFPQFLCLTLLVLVPSLCARLTGAFLDASSTVDIDLRTLLAGGFSFCMMMLTLALWPIYIAGIQILTMDLKSDRRLGFFAALNEAVKFWPRVALLCVLVYGAYFFWTLLPLGLMLILTIGGPSVISIFLALLALAFQVWMVGRLFVNFLFWQQFAVLEGWDPGNALRQSKELARSGRELPWYQRPLWRGVFLASLWFAFVIAVNIGPAWPLLRQYFHELTTSQDPEALARMLAARPRATGLDVTGLALGLLQAVFHPLLGISFVLLYLGAKARFRSPEDKTS